MFHVKQKNKNILREKFKKIKNGVFHVKQFANFSKETIEKLKIYEETLKKWQSKINLISPSTVPDIWNRHIMDSAQLYPLISKQPQIILDLGSGAGFPGLVLAILNQTEGKGNWAVHLVESDSRKCAFMQEVLRLCHIQATVHNCRIEDMPSIKADIITARALKETKTLLYYVIPFLKTDTVCLFLKGENADFELNWAANDYSFLVEKIPSLTKGSFILKMMEIHK